MRERVRAWFRSEVAPIRSARWLAYLALLIAMQIILARFFSIKITEQLRISLGFLPVAVCGFLMGGAPAVFVACVADALGSLLFNPPYMPGFTVTAALNALIFAVTLRALPPRLPAGLRVGRAGAPTLPLAVCVVLGCAGMAFLSNTLLNTYWLQLYYGKAFGALAPARALKNLLEWPVDSLILYATLLVMRRMPRAILPRPLPPDACPQAEEKGENA